MELSAHQWLRNELCRRQSSNSNYSLRAFARRCGISAGHLSEILSGKRAISPRMAKQVRANLDLTPEQTLQWDQLCFHDKGCNVKRDVKLLSEDSFAIIADWRHFAILSALEIKRETITLDWLAKSFGLAPYYVQDALDRLHRLGLVTYVNGCYSPAKGFDWETGDEVPNQAIQSFHKQMLAFASERLTKVPLEERDYLSGTVAVCKANLPKAKRLMRRFRDEMMTLLEDGPADDVYSINLQLFPLTKR